jgi:hypothetical protein
MNRIHLPRLSIPIILIKLGLFADKYESVNHCNNAQVCYKIITSLIGTMRNSRVKSIKNDQERMTKKDIILKKIERLLHNIERLVI